MSWHSAAALLYLLACLPRIKSQGLTEPCDTPDFAHVNATGYSDAQALFTTVDFLGYARTNISTAILATDTDITQHYWVNAPALEGGNSPYLVNNATQGACLVLLGGFPDPNSLKTGKSGSSCAGVLPDSCVEAIVQQYLDEMDVAVQANATDNICAKLLQTAPAQCNGKYAFKNATGVKYMNNPTFFSGSPTCGGTIPFNGSASQGWVIQTESQLSNEDTLETWSGRASILVNGFFERTSIRNTVLCITADDKSAASVQASLSWLLMTSAILFTLLLG